jgi:hypothetical protein
MTERRRDCFQEIARGLPDDRRDPQWDRTRWEPSPFSLFLYSREKKALARNYINTFIWKPALKRAGVTVTRENGSTALRHFYASTALHEGESIKARSEYLGHADRASPCAPTPIWSRAAPSASNAPLTRCSGIRRRQPAMPRRH